MTDPLVLSYLAGVMDSDGFITIKRDEARSSPGSFTHSESIGVGQTSPEAVELFVATFGGRSVLRDRDPRWRPMHYWVLYNKNAAACIQALRPYLRVKAPQADLLLSIRASKSRPGAELRVIVPGTRGWRLHPAVRAERDAAWQAVRALNERRERTQDARFAG